MAPTVAVTKLPSSPPAEMPSSPKRKPPSKAPITPTIRSPTRPYPALHDLTGQPACRDANEDEPQILHLDNPPRLSSPLARRDRLADRPAGVSCDPP